MNNQKASNNTGKQFLDSTWKDHIYSAKENNEFSKRETEISLNSDRIFSNNQKNFRGNFLVYKNLPTLKSNVNMFYINLGLGAF